MLSVGSKCYLSLYCVNRTLVSDCDDNVLYQDKFV